MPEWSNGTDSKSVGLVPTQVRILFSALYFKINIIRINQSILNQQIFKSKFQLVIIRYSFEY